MNVLPIKPHEIANEIPDFVINGANECIKNHYSELTKTSHFTVNELIYYIFQYAPKDLQRQELFDKGWLDIEPLYRRAGWKVEYDKPAYYEDYQPNFTFSF